MLGIFKLKKALLTDDSLSFEQVFKQHYNYVFRLAFNLCGNVADAEDIAQEVFLGVNNSLDGFKGKSQLKTWIYRITIRITYRYLSRLKSNESIDEHEIEIESNAPKMDTSVLKVMLKLPLEQRTIISLIAIEGLSHQQVAEILNVPVGTIGSRLYTARKNLARLLR